MRLCDAFGWSSPDKRLGRADNSYWLVTGLRQRPSQSDKLGVDAGKWQHAEHEIAIGIGRANDPEEGAQGIANDLRVLDGFNR